MLNPGTIKIAIAFDQQLVVDGLDAILSKQKDINVVGIVSNKGDIFETIKQLKPDVIIFEYMFWSTKNTNLMSRLHSMFSDLKILVISELVSHDIIKSLLPFINAYIITTCSSEKLILAVHEIIESGKYLCPKAIDEFFNCTRTVSSETTLTEREKEILCTWIESKNNDEIADNLNISRSTVRTHLNNIRHKLGNLNHLQLMIYACRQNILNRNFKPVCPNCRSFCN